MSFVKNILGMSASQEKDAEIEDDDDDDGTSTESSDTGIFASSDLDSSGHAVNNVVEADCSAISNFFGYW